MPKTLAYSFTLACLFFFSFSAQAEVFRFTGESDKEFTNASNWSPAYPGIIIDESDVVIIESNADFDGPLLLVQGTVRVEHGASLNSPETHLQLAPGASLDLRGTFVGFSIISQGTLMLQSWASIEANEIDFAEGSVSMVMSMASIKVNADATLTGRLDIMGSLEVMGTFHNEGNLIVMAGAEVIAAGGMSMDLDKEIFYHPQADIRIGTNSDGLAASTDLE